MMYYDRQGEPMTRADWVAQFESANRVIAQTTLSDGSLVSTVWLGLDHNFMVYGPPLIFETMVFGKDSRGEEKDMARYSTEAEAIAGHQDMVKKWSPA